MDRYAVLGNPINHSRSPFIHTMFAESTAQNMEYGRLFCPLGEFVKTVDDFRANGGKGLNITVPFKEQAHAYATMLSDRARRAGAVNTLKFNDDGTVYGDNTDGAGFIFDIKRAGWDFTGRRILVLGAGGASRGILGGILDEKPLSVLLVNRTVEKAVVLQQEFGGIEVCSFEDLNCRSDRFEFIINATSLSLNSKLPAIADGLYKDARVYDLMYGSSSNTVFTEHAVKCGAEEAMDGLGMLVGQAAVSFEIWRGVTPEPQPVLDALRQQL